MTWHVSCWKTYKKLKIAHFILKREALKSSNLERFFKNFYNCCCLCNFLVHELSHPTEDISMRIIYGVYDQINNNWFRKENLISTTKYIFKGAWRGNLYPDKNESKLNSVNKLFIKKVKEAINQFEHVFMMLLLTKAA